MKTKRKLHKKITNKFKRLMRYLVTLSLEASMINRDFNLFNDFWSRENNKEILSKCSKQIETDNLAIRINNNKTPFKATTFLQ